jgi:hypothetical protein
MWNFFALMILMGLVKYPKTSYYWSRYFLYQNTLEPAVMTQNSFQNSLRFLHFADSTLTDDDYIAKVQPLISLLVQNFKKFTPGALTIIDEIMVPFRGQLIFKQYIAGKSL